MRRSILVIVVLALAAAGAVAVVAEKRARNAVVVSAESEAGAPCGPSEAEASGEVASVAVETSGGKIAGRFDPAMSGVCRFGCATTIEHEAKDVLAQPGAIAGKLTQCPVSGVVFAVDDGRPHVIFAGEDYVTCCDRCAGKLERDPGRYLKL